MLGRGRRALRKETRQIPKEEEHQRQERAQQNNSGEYGQRIGREPMEEWSHRPLPLDLARDGGRKPRGPHRDWTRSACVPFTCVGLQMPWAGTSREQAVQGPSPPTRQMPKARSYRLPLLMPQGHELGPGERMSLHSAKQ